MKRTSGGLRTGVRLHRGTGSHPDPPEPLDAEKQDDGRRTHDEGWPACEPTMRRASFRPRLLWLTKESCRRCAGSSRSDGWAEVTWRFSTELSLDAVKAFYRCAAGRGRLGGRQYGDDVMLSQKGGRQLRLYSQPNGEPYRVIVGAPLEHEC